MARWTTTIALGALIQLTACEDTAGREALEAERAKLEVEIAALKAEHEEVKEVLRKRPARPPSFEARAEKIVEIFSSCEDPCAEILREKSESIRDEAQHEALQPTLGACIARCVK